MNRIFMVVFDKAKQMYVVGNEDTRTQGKSGGAKATILVAITTGMLGFAGLAQAGYYYNALSQKQEYSGVKTIEGTNFSFIASGDYAIRGNTNDDFTINATGDVSVVSMNANATIWTQNGVDNIHIALNVGNSLTISSSKVGVHAYKGSPSNPTSINLSAKDIEVVAGSYGFYGQTKYAQVNAIAEKSITVTATKDSAAVRGQVSMQAPTVNIYFGNGQAGIQTNGDRSEEGFTTTNIGSSTKYVKNLNFYGKADKTGLSSDGGDAIQLYRVNDKVNVFAERVSVEVAEGKNFILASGTTGAVNIAATESIDIVGNIINTNSTNSNVAINGYVVLV